ncbi:RNA polymerase sigma factor [Peribacillus deserti]|uniref:RNA polymerase sigma factor n=1 Tax=Peribacillus deserti TaxID=673318 RepID=UPI0021523585|nr:sigma factor-like helix-turn-helix DNA-binding protein [Peribacillus deserti]
MLYEETVGKPSTEMDTPLARLLMKEKYQLLLSGIDLLKEVEKHAVILCDLHGMSNQEAAAVLNVKLNTLKSHLLRGRKKLKEFLKERKE